MAALPRPHGQASPAAAADPGSAPPLPVPLTALVGRADLVERVQHLLLDRASRLATLVGPGGVGKSRVALAAAAGVAAAFPDGRWLVPLAPIRDPGLVLPAVLAVLGLRVGAAETPAAALQAALRERRLLLVLDNMEQVADAGPLVADLLRACPGVVALVTSRRRLRLRGERVVEVGPLPLPGADPESADPAALGPAVELFVQRARDAAPGFVLDAGNAPAVAEIARRLDGLPLALELAAARTGVLPPPALLARLDKALPLLADGPADLPDRLRTMRGAIAWSVDLLAAEEAALLPHLAVFAGGFTAAQVEAAAPAAPAGRGRAIDLLAALVDHSLVQRDERISRHGTRFRMLETVREFVLERLEADPAQAEDARARHAAVFADLAAQAWDAQTRWRDTGGWIARLDADLPNLRTALERLLTADPTAALRMAGDLAWYWYDGGHRSEGRGWIRRTLAAAPAAPAAVRAKARFADGLLAHWQGDDAAALPAFAESLALWRVVGDRWGIRYATLFRGIVLTDAGAYAEAAALLAESRGRGQADGDWGAEGYALSHLGIATWGAAGAAAAEPVLLEALAFHAAHGNPIGENMGAVFLALVAAERGRLDEAAAFVARSAELCRTIAAREEAAFCLASAAVVATRRGDAARAARLFGAEAALRERLGIPWKLPERDAYEPALAAARAALGRSFGAAWRAGRALPLPAALDEAAGEPPADARGAPAAVLSPREREVLRLVAAGRTNAEIGQALFISPGTARIHVSNILGKLGARSRSEAAAVARERGLL
jgi:predicted ATPase/DNA-binding CsgD family transcriptional regulator